MFFMLRTAALPAARSLAAVALMSAMLVASGGAQARLFGWATEEPTVFVSELPEQGQQTYRLIFQGGPFFHDKDGAVFGNRERLLPAKKRGYYREYTVETPGSRDRGARRIVCGGERRTAPKACYYTSDHYSSFKRIVE